MINKELEMLDEDRMDRVIKLLTLLDKKDEITLNELNSCLKKFDDVTVQVECDDDEILEAYEELRDEKVELLQKCENLKGRLKDKNEEIDYLETYVEELQLEKSLVESLRVIESSEDLIVDVDLIEYWELYREQCNRSWLMYRISDELGIEEMHFEYGYDDKLNKQYKLKVVKNLHVSEEKKNKLDGCLAFVMRIIESTLDSVIEISMVSYLDILLVKNNVAWLIKEIKNRGIEEVRFNWKHQKEANDDWAVINPVLKIKIPSDWEG